MLSFRPDSVGERLLVTPLATHTITPVKWSRFDACWCRSTV